MAPKKPQRTPRLSTAFDKSYTCTNEECDLDALVLGTDMDKESWTCYACGDPALIEMQDRSGRNTDVRRCQAKDIEIGRMVYRDNNLDTAYRVVGSRQGTGKENGDKWMLGLADQGSAYFVPEQYVNRVP
ncbi:hypothetical protein [Pseudomonas viridiflava]|uniref:hypothetical protein n=1 Tax=Pseudomonas viridiflava TaxID=33069 RepID=UPI002E9E41D1|nr:hypothetical protein [Pseudomonas viridiflava]